jgi:hypothetical protein
MEAVEPLAVTEDLRAADQAVLVEVALLVLQ